MNATSYIIRKKIKVKTDQKLKFNITYKIKLKAIRINKNGYMTH